VKLKLSYNVLTDVADTLEGGFFAHFGARWVCDVAHQDLEKEKNNMFGSGSEQFKGILVT